MSKMLLDTNVLIYAIDQDSVFYAASRAVLDSDDELFTTSKNLSEFLAVITRAPIISLPIEDALAALDDLTSRLTVLYPNEASWSQFRTFLQQYKPTGIRIHDVEIASIGLAHDIKRIATFNRKDFEGISEIEIVQLTV